MCAVSWVAKPISRIEVLKYAKESSITMTSAVRASSATAPHLPDAGRQRLCRSGQTQDLPASDAIPLRVMWPSTPAGRQHLA